MFVLSAFKYQFNFRCKKQPQMFTLVKQLLTRFAYNSNRKSCAVTVWSGLLSIPMLPLTSSKTSVSVLRASVSTVTAACLFLIWYEIFMHVLLAYSCTDFSDRISKSRRVGYESGDYELVSSPSGSLLSIYQSICSNNEPVHLCHFLPSLVKGVGLRRLLSRSTSGLLMRFRSSQRKWNTFRLGIGTHRQFLSFFF